MDIVYHTYRISKCLIVFKWILLESKEHTLHKHILFKGMVKLLSLQNALADFNLYAVSLCYQSILQSLAWTDANVHFNKIRQQILSCCYNSSLP